MKLELRELVENKLMELKLKLRNNPTAMSTLIAESIFYPITKEDNIVGLTLEIANPYHTWKLIDDNGAIEFLFDGRASRHY